MEVTSAYMYSVARLPKMFEAIQRAKVPPRFTHEFLQTLGFKSTNDRAFINVLKGLGFLDQNAVPTSSYHEYRDKSRAKHILARQMRTAYQGLFLTDENAQDLDDTTLKGRLASLTGKEESVINKMAATFKALADLADFSEPSPEKQAPGEETVESPALEKPERRPTQLAFAHSVFINLPATRDVAVYDAIFKSIKEHLL